MGLADLKPSAAAPCQEKEAGAVFCVWCLFKVQGTITASVTKVKYEVVTSFVGRLERGMP